MITSSIALVDPKQESLDYFSNLIKSNFEKIELNTYKTYEDFSQANIDFDFVIIDLFAFDHSIYKSFIQKLTNVGLSKIIVLTESDDYLNLLHTFQLGIQGYILKVYQDNLVVNYLNIFFKKGSMVSPVMLKKLIGVYSQNQESKNSLKKLTAKDIELLHLISKGYSYTVIAEKANLTLNGIRSRVKSVYKKLNVNSKVEALKYYYNKVV